MGFGGTKALEWDQIIRDMQLSRICRGEDGDYMGWNGDMKRGAISVSNTYKIHLQQL